MTTPIEVVDSAVKIGLGALLSGVGAFTVARMNHSREIEKERLRRRRELYETVAEQVETFTHVVLKYWSIMIEIARYRGGNREMPAERVARIDPVRDELYHAFKEMTSAEAKLLLLGQKSAQRLLRDYGDEVVRRRAHAFAANLQMTEEQLAEDRLVLLVKREAFFDSLSALYLEHREPARTVAIDVPDAPGP
jgi:hypothetical protein